MITDCNIILRLTRCKLRVVSCDTTESTWNKNPVHFCAIIAWSKVVVEQFKFVEWRGIETGKQARLVRAESVQLQGWDSTDRYFMEAQTTPFLSI